MVRAGRVRQRRDGEVPGGGPRPDAPAELGRQLGLGAPHERDLATLELGCDPVDGGRPGPAPRSRPSFTARSGPVTSLPRRDRSPACGPSARPGTGPTCGHRWRHRRRPTSGRRGRAGPPSRPRADTEQVARSTTRGASSEGRPAWPRRTGHHKHGEPLEWHRLVPDQPRQIGAHRQQQDVDALPPWRCLAAAACTAQATGWPASSCGSSHRYRRTLPRSKPGDHRPWRRGWRRLHPQRWDLSSTARSTARGRLPAMGDEPDDPDRETILLIHGMAGSSPHVA